MSTQQSQKSRKQTRGWKNGMDQPDIAKLVTKHGIDKENIWWWSFSNREEAQKAHYLIQTLNAGNTMKLKDVHSKVGFQGGFYDNDGWGK